MFLQSQLTISEGWIGDLVDLYLTMAPKVNWYSKMSVFLFQDNAGSDLILGASQAGLFIKLHAGQTNCFRYVAASFFIQLMI